MKIQKKITLLLVLIITTTIIRAQTIDFDKKSDLGKLFIKLYGEMHYYQPIGGEIYRPAQLDAKRLVTLFGYQFNKSTQFVSEIEFEHASEAFLEQAFIKHRIKGNLSLKAGLMLIPMGMVNENHEPVNYYSVDRPTIDKKLVPTTWRELGIGITGILPSYDVKYQVYLVNGLMGFKGGSAKFSAEKPYRSGRQKAIKSTLSGLPSIASQIEYYGLSNGKIGLSWYSGSSNTDAYNGLLNDDEAAINSADSTTIHTNMIGIHSTLNFDQWKVRSQMIYALNSGVEAYNTKTKADLADSSLGAYIEIGRTISSNKKWSAFGRYSYIDTVVEDRASVDNQNIGLDHIAIIGLNYNPAEGAVFKIEAKWSQLHLDENLFNINTAVGVWF